MRIKPAFGGFLAFTAIFAALAALVFWGTWSLDVVPVMPDAQTTFPADFAARQWQSLLANGKFIPSHLQFFLGSPYFWTELQYVIALYAAALGMAYFCFGRGLKPVAAYGAGLFLAFCGYWCTLFSAGHMGWFYWMTYGVFAFGLADRAVRLNQLRHWLGLGLAVAWAGFNQQDLWLLFTVLTAAYFGWCCWRERRFPWRGTLVAAGVFILVSLPNLVDTLTTTIAARKLQIQQFSDASKQSAPAKEGQKGGQDEAAVRWEFVTNWSMPFEDTLEFFDARVHGDTSCPIVLSIGQQKATGVRPYVGALGRPLKAAQGNYRQHSLYVGVITCLLALIGTIAGFRRPDVRFFAVAALAVYALSLGRYFEPAYRLIYALPAGDLIRCPVKWHHLTEFCLVVLAGYGIDVLARWRYLANRWGRALLASVVLAGAINLAIEAHRYCAPLNVREARRHNASAELSVLSRADFSRPEVAELVRRQEIVSVANYLGNPNYYLVEVIKRYGPASAPAPLSPMRLALGLISVLSALAALAYGQKCQVVLK